MKQHDFLQGRIALIKGGKATFTHSRFYFGERRPSGMCSYSRADAGNLFMVSHGGSATFKNVVFESRFACCQPLGEKKERLESKLKSLKSQVNTERASFSVIGPKLTQEEVKEEIVKTTQKLEYVTEQLET